MVTPILIGISISLTIIFSFLIIRTIIEIKKLGYKEYKELIILLYRIYRGIKYVYKEPIISTYYGDYIIAYLPVNIDGVLYILRKDYYTYSLINVDNSIETEMHGQVITTIRSTKTWVSNAHINCEFYKTIKYLLIKKTMKLSYGISTPVKTYDDAINIIKLDMKMENREVLINNILDE